MTTILLTVRVHARRFSQKVVDRGGSRGLPGLRLGDTESGRGSGTKVGRALPNCGGNGGISWPSADDGARAGRRLEACTQRWLMGGGRVSLPTAVAVSVLDAQTEAVGRVEGTMTAVPLTKRDRCAKKFAEGGRSGGGRGWMDGPAGRDTGRRAGSGTASPDRSGVQCRRIKIARGGIADGVASGPITPPLPAGASVSGALREAVERGRTMRGPAADRGFCPAQKRRPVGQPLRPRWWDSRCIAPGVRGWSERRVRRTDRA
jgi:hypothetical protein